MNIHAPLWCVARTHPHAEYKAAAHLARQGFEVYLPRYLKRRCLARKLGTVAAPLFPRYLFVLIGPLIQRWRAINSTFGVTHLVCCGDGPALVPVDVITGLRLREDESGFIRPREIFGAGEKIRIVGSAFYACLGLFEEKSDGERVTILLELLGRSVKAFVDKGAIEAV